MHDGWMLPILVLLPALCAGTSLVLPSARAVLRFCAVGTLAVAAGAAACAAAVCRCGPVSAAGGWFLLDPLSAWHMAVMAAVFSLSALYGLVYFRAEAERRNFTSALARRYGGLWFGAMAAMMLVLVSNNLGVMWVGIEATTLLTAFLICIHSSPGALEAMWKYLLMCSVGVAMAFVGILLIAASTGAAGLHGTDALLWTHLRDGARGLDPMLLKAGFLFVVVGYGTKAGLAPMHNWLPDAHSQAPAPVSAVFSGFLLNAALYCILRCLPLVEAATGDAAWGEGILVALGALSILVAAVFILGQSDVKRFLAYSSVEHLGIVALGVGLGGAGAAAALLHILNHSLGKTLAFLCAGRLGQIYGTHDMRRMGGMLRVAPAWGGGLLLGVLALIGVAPFAIFLSEFMILKAALDSGRVWVAVLFLTGLGIVFVGALRHIIPMAWGDSSADTAKAGKAGPLEWVLAIGPLLALLALGVWIPAPVRDALAQAAQVLEGQP
jgi:hydrogenase-4 component F